MTGRQVSHFRVDERLGSGGMGVVYRAFDLTLERPVALKVLTGEDWADEERRRRFLVEAKAASSLTHPNIVAVYEVGSEGGLDYIAMELIEGQTLSELLRRAPLPPDLVYRYGAEVCDALTRAHESGVIHRDLKPGNIMVTRDGHVKLLDFGLAKVQRTSSPVDPQATATALTQIGQVMGTPAYMSPEQAMGQPVDARSDIFSLGCVLYEMWNGAPPFEGKTTLQILRQVVSADPPGWKKFESEAPEPFVELLGQMLVKDPEGRPTAAEVAGDLRSLSGPGLAISKGTRRIRRRWFALGGAVALAATGWASRGWWWPGGQSPAIPRIEREVLPGVDPKASVRDLMDQGMRCLRLRYLKNGPERAAEFFQLALQADPESAAARAGLSMAYRYRYLAQREPQWLKQAMDSAAEAVARGPLMSVNQLALSGAYEATGKLPEARKSAAEAIRLDPGNALAHVQLASVLRRQGELEAGVAELGKALKIAPDLWEGYSLLGTIEYGQGNLEQAIEAFEKMRRYAPSNGTAYFSQAAALHQLGRTDEAAGVLQAGLAIRPSEAMYANLGTLVFFQGKYAEAAKYFEEGIRLGAANDEAWGSLGDAQRWAAGQREKSLESYATAIRLARKSLETSPSVGTRRRLAGYLAKSGAIEGARRELAVLEGEAKLKGPDWYAMAVVAEVTGDRAKALAFLDKAFTAGYSTIEADHDPELLGLRSDPRYQQMVTRVARTAKKP
jgi:serine/threonine-protein kinase